MSNPDYRSSEAARAVVVDAVVRLGGATQSEIVETAAARQPLSLSSVSRAAADLRGLDILGPKEDGARNWTESIRADLGAFIGLSIAPGSAGHPGTVSAAAIDAAGEDLVGPAAACLTTNEPKTVHAACYDLASGLVQRLRGKGYTDRNMRVAVSVGGHVDRTDGRILSSPNLAWRVSDRPASLTTSLGDALDLPVYTVNDVNALALHERWFGAARDEESFAVVIAGEHIGASVMLGGELWRGRTGMAGELGHLPAARFGSSAVEALVCGCGRTGCLETVATASRVLDQIMGLDGGKRFESLAEADGHNVATPVLRRAGELLGASVATLVNLFDVPRVILYGEMFHSSVVVCRAATSTLAESVFPTIGVPRISYLNEDGSIEPAGPSMAAGHDPRDLDPTLFNEPVAGPGPSSGLHVMVRRGLDPNKYPKAAATVALRRGLQRLAGLGADALL